MRKYSCSQQELGYFILGVWGLLRLRAKKSLLWGFKLKLDVDKMEILLVGGWSDTGNEIALVLDGMHFP